MKSPFRALPLLAFLLLLCLLRESLAQTPQPLAQDDFTLGGLAEDTDSAAVRARFGKPDSVFVDNHPFDVDAKLVSWVYPRFTVFFFSMDHVVGIRTRDSRVATQRGLRVGDSVARLRRLYGEPTSSYHDDIEYEDPGEHLHIMRVTVREGHVAEIYVGWILD